MSNPVSERIKDEIENLQDLLIRAGAEDLLRNVFGVDSVRIENVIFNPPATIIFWSDDTKTVVKTQNGEHFDKEKGLAMGICKKIAGNRGAYYDIFKAWCYDEETEHEQK